MFTWWKRKARSVDPPSDKPPIRGRIENRQRDIRSVDPPSGKPPIPQDLRCSFCNKAQRDVSKLIAGPTVFICDECVDVCVDIIADDERLQRRPRDSPSYRHRHRIWRSAAADPATCSLCGESVVSIDALPIENRGVICGVCADAVEDALGHGRPAS